MRNIERLARPWVKRGLVGVSVIWVGYSLGFSADQGQKSLDVYGQPLEGWPTRSPATATAVPTGTPMPTITPIPSATPDIQATIRAAITAAAPAFATPFIITPKEVTPIIVKPEVVKPEVVKPEVVKPEVVKPEIIQIPVPVTPVRDPNVICLDRQALDSFILDGVKIALSQQVRTPTPTSTSTPTPLPYDSRFRNEGGWHFDLWSGIIGGAIGLGIGAIAFTRPQVLTYMHEHGHIHLPPPSAP